MIKEFIRKHLFIIIFSVAGVISGFLYWKFVGCLSGSCPIKSKWYLSTLWGLAFGYLTGSIIRDLMMKFKAKKKANEDGKLNKEKK